MSRKEKCICSILLGVILACFIALGVTVELRQPQTQTIIKEVPGPTVTKIVYRTKTVTITPPTQVKTITQYTNGYQYDSQNPAWNCWGDLINHVPYQSWCITHEPN